jgi:hypothetical protein
LILLQKSPMLNGAATQVGSRRAGLSFVIPEENLKTINAQ